MSESVVPTPSEQPKCGDELCDGSHYFDVKPERPFPKGTYCPGPVIATEPETPASEDDELGEVSPLLEAFRRRNPAPEAMCEVHLEKDGRLRVTAWVRPDQMYATLDAFSGALEPVPEDATCKWCGDTIQHIVDEDCWIHADGKSRWIQCNRDADPASDPSPEMREKVEALRARPNAPTSYDWGWNQALDAVLAALKGEPK